MNLFIGMRNVIFFYLLIALAIVLTSRLCKGSEPQSNQHYYIYIKNDPAFGRILHNVKPYGVQSFDLLLYPVVLTSWEGENK